MTSINYVGIIHKESDSDYGICFPDFPGCITAGKTVEEAHRLAHEALALHVKGMEEDGDALPRPSTFEQVKSHYLYKNAVMTCMVEVTTRPKLQRVHMMMDETLLAQIDAVSKNRSAFLTEATRFYLRQTQTPFSTE